MKKFKVRVNHFSEGLYAVEYVHYRWFYIFWTPLYFWFDQGHPGGTECWSINLFSVDTAERIARSLKSIEDVDKYYKPEREKQRLWVKNEREWWKNNAPYSTKIYK